MAANLTLKTDEGVGGHGGGELRGTGVQQTNVLELQLNNTHASAEPLGGIFGKDKGCKDIDIWWHLKASPGVNAEEAWKYSRTMGKPEKGEGIMIAMPDTGYGYHVFTSTFVKATQKQKWPETTFTSRGYNFREENEYAYDPMNYVIGNKGHGTMVAALAAGDGEEPDKYGNVIPGAAPKAGVMPLRIVDSVVSHNANDRLRRAIDYAKDNKAHVVSMSIGSVAVGADLREVKMAIDDAINHNMILVAAGGQAVNIFKLPADTVFPSSYEQVISVGGITMKSKYWSEGFKGRDIAFTGPAKDVCVANLKDWGDQSKGVGKGTSLSTALTAGVAALWLAHHGRDELISVAKQRDEKLQHLFCKAVEASVYKPSGWRDYRQGAGIIDALALLQQDLEDLVRLPAGKTSHCTMRPCSEDEACIVDKY